MESETSQYIDDQRATINRLRELAGMLLWHLLEASNKTDDLDYQSIMVLIHDAYELGVMPKADNR